MKSDHWQNIYKTKNEYQVSWTQPYPQIAIDYIKELGLPFSAKIIDIGGGSGNFVDALLDLGYTNITVLDISEAALEKSKARLGIKADSVTWLVQDILEFTKENKYDFWYDRAVFHFLISEKDVASYLNIVNKSMTTNGNLLIGTFSEKGPLKCSGLKIRRYSAKKLQDIFNNTFITNRCFKHLHETPFRTKQEFQFCGFIKL